MLFYSFLGLLTLQIGVAVLAALFITLGFVVGIATFPDFHMEQETPINYIIVAIVIILILIAGLVMFMGAYHESKFMCTFSIVSVSIILVIYLIASIVSFLNMPSITKDVCVYNNHCPESFWLSGLNYRKNSGADEVKNEYVTTEEPEAETDTTTEQVTHEPGPDDNVSTEEANFERRNRKWRKEKPHSPTAISNKHINASKPSKTNDDSEIDLTVQFPIDATALKDRLFEDYKDNDGFLRIVKRSVSFIENYFKEEPSPRIHELIQQKYKRDSDNAAVTVGDTTEGENEESTTESGSETNPKEKGNSEYSFGYDFFVSVILFLLITIFFIFTIVVLLSYRKQLIYISLYSENPASKHYLV